MEAKILKLIELIGEEVVIFEKFLQYLNRQQEALVANDLEALQAVTLQQEELAQHTSAVEKRRRELVEELSVDLNRHRDDINLSELARLVSEPHGSEIRALQQTLLNLHEQISAIKTRNDFLIRKSMEYLNTTMIQMGIKDAPSAPYSAGTTQSSAQAKSGATILLDRRV